MAQSWGDSWGTSWGESWGAAGSAPAYIFKAQVVPVYVAPDPTAAGVVPVVFVADAPGVTRVHTIDYADRVAGCVPIRTTTAGVGVVPVREEP